MPYNRAVRPTWLTIALPLLWAIVGQYNANAQYSATVVFHNNTASTVNLRFVRIIYGGASCSGGTQTDIPTALIAAGGTVTTTTSWSITGLSYSAYSDSTPCGGTVYAGGSACQGGNPDGGTFTVTASNGGGCTVTSSFPPATYPGCVCVTNTQTGPVYPIGASYSGVSCPGDSSLPTGSAVNSQTGPLLQPGGVWCYCYTNSAPGINLVLMPVLDSTGFSDNFTVVCQQAGTNNSGFQTPKGGNGNGVPQSTNANVTANAPNAGWGNNTNLTGNQYANGVSNIIANATANATALGNGLGAGFNNVVTQLRYMGTNSPGTNSGTSSNSFIIGAYWQTNFSGNLATNIGSGTNYSSISNAVYAGPMGTVLTQLDSIKGSLLTWSNNWQAFPPGDGSAEILKAHHWLPGAGSAVLDATIFPSGTTTLIKNAIGWIAGLSFLIWLIAKYQECLKIASATQTGGVPDLDTDIPVFGNFFGTLAAPVVSLIIIIVFAAALVLIVGAIAGFIFSGLISLSPFSAWTGGYLGYMDGLMYWINQLLPLSLLFGFLAARMILDVVIGGLMTFAMAVCRFLWGR